MLYRIKQFFWVMESLYKKEDIYFLEKYLDDDEKKLFQLLSKSDRQHSIRVAKDLLKYFDISGERGIFANKDRLVKAALLHDIGKVERHLNVFEKSIIVILDKLTRGKIIKYKKFKIIDVYYNHPKKGYDILKKQEKYDIEFLKIIEEHHGEEDTSDEIIKLIRYFDDKN